MFNRRPRPPAASLYALIQPDQSYAPEPAPELGDPALTYIHPPASQHNRTYVAISNPNLGRPDPFPTTAGPLMLSLNFAPKHIERTQKTRAESCLAQNTILLLRSTDVGEHSHEVVVDGAAALAFGFLWFCANTALAQPSLILINEKAVFDDGGWR